MLSRRSPSSKVQNVGALAGLRLYGKYLSLFLFLSLSLSISVCFFFLCCCFWVIFCSLSLSLYIYISLSLSLSLSRVSYVSNRTVWMTDRAILNLLRAGTTPILEKKRSEKWWANENISCGFPSIPRIAPGVAPRSVVFVLLKLWDAIPRMEFRTPRMEFWIPRVAPRITRNAPRASRMAFSLRERFSWKWGGPQASENR